MGGASCGLVDGRGGRYHRVGGDQSARGGSRVVQGAGRAHPRVVSAWRGAGRGGRGTMLGTMMYPGADDADLEDMRVPPIQLEHLPEVFLCT